MFKKLCLLTTSLVLVGGTVWAEEPAPYNCDFSPSCEVAPGIYGAMGSPVMSKFKMSIGGYIKLDYANNTNAVGPLAPGAPGGQIAPRPAAGTHDESLFTARQSRFWLKVAGPTFLGAKTNALVEMDFYGTGQLSNEFGNARMRHAYGSIDWTNTQILFGQFWDTFGPAASDTIDFRQGGTTGAPSNPRVAQIRLTQKVNFTPNESLKLVVALQNPTQDNATQAGPIAPVSGATGFSGASSIFGSAGDGSMSRYFNTYGSMVNVAGQAIFSSKILGVSPGMMSLGMAPLQLGVFGIDGNMKLDGNNHPIQVYGYGAYVFVPVLKSSDGKNRKMTLSLEGQVYQGQALDVQGGTNGTVSAGQTGLVGSTVATTTLAGAKGQGYYGQLKFHPTQDFALTLGHMARLATDATQFDAANNTAGALRYEKKNQLSYANVTYDLNAAIRVATEFEHMESRYGNPGATLATGAYGQNNTYRVAAYYFF